MDKEYIQENQVIERYLQNKLSEEEAQAFEEFYLGDPETLEDLELAESLQRGVKDLGASGYLRAAKLRRLFLSPQYASAASVLALMGMLTSGLFYQQVQTVAQAPASTRIVPIFTTRGATSVNVIDQGAAREQTVLLVDPGILTFDSYRATVTRQNGEQATEIWRGEGLELGYEDMLALGLPSGLLPPGDYKISVEGRVQGTDQHQALNRLDFRIADETAP